MKRRILVVVTVLPMVFLWVGCEKDSPNLCGNGVQDRSETCDGSQVGNQSCEGLGYAGGQLACNDTCDGYDTTYCLPAICGNGNKEPGEICDGQDFGGQSCTTLAMGFAGGELQCLPDCSAFDTSGCLLPDYGGLEGMVWIDAAVTCDASVLTVDCAGDLYIRLYRNDPLIQPNQVPEASAVLWDANLSGDASQVPYSISEVPVGTFYLTAFLDDNDNADLTAQKADAGDPTMEPIQVTITMDNVTQHDIALTHRKE